MKREASPLRMSSDHESKVVRLDQHARHQHIQAHEPSHAHTHEPAHEHTHDSLTNTEPSPSDNELYQAIKQGNAEALGALYDRYVAKVYRIVKRLIADDLTVQEVIQDVFTRIWTTQAFDANLGAFSHWLAVVARRIAIDHVRKHRPPTTPWPQEDVMGADDTEKVTSNRILRSDLVAAMSNLDDDLRTVLQLAYFEGYTLAEISSRLGIPLGTVKSKLYRGLKKMRVAMIHWTGEVQP
jgi:RNA polymerase sigma-70 factor (ECF subfamily)